MMETSVTCSMWGTQNGLFWAPNHREKKQLLRAFRGEHQSWSEGRILKGCFKFIASVKISRKNRRGAWTWKLLVAFCVYRHHLAASEEGLVNDGDDEEEENDDDRPICREWTLSWGQKGGASDTDKKNERKSEVQDERGISINQRQEQLVSNIRVECCGGFW